MRFSVAGVVLIVEFRVVSETTLDKKDERYLWEWDLSARGSETDTSIQC